MKSSDQINELASALSKAQAKVEQPKKDADNPFFHSKYASLPAYIHAMKGPFTEEGLSIVQFPAINETGDVGISTRVMHSSGQWIESDIFTALQVKKNFAQEIGSLITYLRRYTLGGIGMIFQEDEDDMESATDAPVVKASGKAKNQAEMEAGIIADLLSDAGIDPKQWHDFCVLENLSFKAQEAKLLARIAKEDANAKEN